MNRFLHCFFNHLPSIPLHYVVALFLFLVSANFFAPFFADDYFQQLLLRADGLITRQGDGSFFGLFSFIDPTQANQTQLQQFGVLPWFAAEDFSFRFFRPIAELTHYLDYWLAPENAFVAHTQNILWAIVAAFGVYFLAQKTFNNTAIACLAFIVFLLDGQHVATIAWVANRNLLIAAVFLMAALWAFIHWRQTQQKRYLLYSLLAFATALFSSESALSLIFYVIFYFYLVERNTLQKKIWALLPYGLIAALWLFFYQFLGFGAYTSGGLYLSPWQDFSVLSQVLLPRLSAYILAAFLPVPAGAMWVLADFSAWLIGVALLFSVAVFCAISFFFRQQKVLLFWFFSGVFALLPACAALPQDRLSFIGSIGLDIALAAIIVGLWQMKNTLFTLSYQRILVALLLFIHLVLSPLHLFAGTLFMQHSATQIRDRALNLALSDTKKNVLVLQMPIGEAVSLMGIRAFYHAPLADKFIWLASDEAPLQSKRIDSNTLRLAKPTGFTSGFEAAFGQGVGRFSIGQEIDFQGIKITIIQLNKAQLPSVIELHFDAEKTQLMTWQQGCLIHID